MLNIKKAFEKLMLLLNDVNPKTPLPAGLGDYLLENMEEISPKANEVLVEQGEVPKHAYYIIRGFVYVYYLDAEGEKHVKRFYRENRIVAFLSFLEQHASPYYIIAGRNALLSRISSRQMQGMYEKWQGLREVVTLVMLRYEEAVERFREEMVTKRGAIKVLGFYKVFPEFLHSRIISNDMAASFLLMKRVRFIELRTGLIRKGLLPGR